MLHSTGALEEANETDEQCYMEGFSRYLNTGTAG